MVRALRTLPLLETNSRRTSASSASVRASKARSACRATSSAETSAGDDSDGRVQNEQRPHSQGRV
ncbi:MAG TPA: hypothetical protein VJ739_18760 [Gemmataceae bacterium]|nr:hypothetical protein [Gemmataceae bacterium]